MAGVDSLVIAAFGALVWTSLAVWRRVIARLRRRQPIVPRENVNAAPWGLADLLITLALIFLALGLGRNFVAQRHGMSAGAELTEFSPAARVALVWASSLATVLGTAASLLLIRQRTQASPSALGWDARRVGYDVRLGCAAFALLAAPVLGIQMVLTHWFPSQHPLIEMIREHPDPRFLWANGVAAVLVAPVCEEIVFRMLIQGWLQNLTRRGLGPQQWLLGPNAATTLALPPPNVEQRREVVDPEIDESTTDAERATRRQSSSIVARWGPIVASSTLFAAAHATHGPDPVPLFILSLGLGYLYETTGRILPGIVVHFLLNSWTMMLLLLYVLTGNSL